ncbi:MAG: hypothetical protein GEV11_00595 [Streptosporangiales bacterium]|nr:hypothetical protein [Streptosporangiales bacterium]
MSWTWRFETAEGREVSGMSQETFPGQGDAESWIGENWRELLDQGVDQVTLRDGTREVYTMSLHTES